MNQNKRSGFICGLYPFEQDYEINGVRYTVHARFLSLKESDATTIEDCFIKLFKSKMTPLQTTVDADKLDAEYMYLAAGKEDSNAVKEENRK